MGTWGRGSFSNDKALDWLYNLVDLDTKDCVERILSELAASPEYAYRNAERGLAAVEVVAAYFGAPRSSAPDELYEWVKAMKSSKHSISKDLVMLAITYATSVLNNSEVKDLWKPDAEYYEEWRKDVGELIARLKSIP